MFGFRKKKIRKNASRKQSNARRRRGPQKTAGKKVLRGIMVLGMVTVCVVGVWGFEKVESVMMNWTTVKNVTIVGLKQLQREDVLSELALSPTTSLFNIHPEDVAARLEANSWIATASVGRIFPHTLAVQVVEREASAIAQVSQQRYLIDQDGYVLESFGDRSYPTLPILFGLQATNNMERVEPHARQGIQVAQLLSRVFHTVPTVTVEGKDSIVGDIPGNRFQFGMMIDEQWKRFQSLYPSIQTRLKREPTEIDLRYAGKVILRKRE